MEAALVSMKERHATKGARFGEAEGLERLLAYSGFDREYEALERGCALFDLSDRGLLEVTGEDRVRFLNNLLSNDVKALAPGHGCHAALLDRKSKVLALMTCLAFEGSVLLETEPGLQSKLSSLLGRYRIADRVGFAVRTGEWNLLSLQGPEAPALARNLFGVRVEEIPPGGHAASSWRGVPLQWLRLPRTARPGLDLLLPSGEGEAIWRLLEAEGAVPSGWDTLETARVEAGHPRYGADVTEEHLLAEANLPEAVSFSKGCYVGQEVVARIKSRGHVNRTRAGLLIEGPASPGDDVAVESQAASRLTSARHSPRLGRTVAFAYLKAELAGQIGAECRIRNGRDAFSATVTPYPFISKA